MDQYPPFDEDRLLHLLREHIRHSLTADEKKELQRFAESSEEYKHLLAEISDESVRELLLKQQQTYSVDTALARVKNKTGRETPNSLKLRIYTIVAIAATLLLATFLILYYSNVPNLNTPGLNAKQNIKVLPGSNKATLTLANGKKINLGDTQIGIIAQQSGAVIQKHDDGLIAYLPSANHTDTATEYNLIETPRGGQYRLQLPDGTKVWLNAASTLKYPSSFKGKNREVTLTGEGYFEVVHNARKPFIVKTSNQSIKDIGTSFNVNAYTDEPHISTTLVEGSVQISTGHKSTILKPGQQAINTSGSIKVSAADLGTATAWKDGQITFIKTDLRSVLRQISRWYNIDVEYHGNVPNETITGEVSRNADLSAMLEILRLSDIHYIQDGHKLTIKP